MLISRFYEQFSRNGSAMAPEQLLEKISNLQNMNILYVIFTLRRPTTLETKGGGEGVKVSPPVSPKWRKLGK